MREDPRFDYQAVVTEEVVDDFLDDLLALRWKENLKLRAYAKECNSRKKIRCAIDRIKYGMKKRYFIDQRIQ